MKMISPLRPDFKLVEEYMSESFESGQLSNFGPCYHKLAARLHSFLGLAPEREIILTSSCHTALMAAYKVLGTKDASVSAYTFPSTATAAQLQGIRVKYLDVSKELAYPILSKMRRGETLVITTPLSLIPNFDAIEVFCSEQGVKLIIDGAPSFGTPDIYNYGDAFCLSFHATKTFGIGEGGAIICDKLLASSVRQYLNFGMNAKKEILSPGINGKISEYACAVGLALLDTTLSILQHKKVLAAAYRLMLPSFCLTSEISNTTYQTFPIFLPSFSAAQRVREELTKHSIPFLQYYRPLAPLKNAMSLYRRNICLPIHQDISLSDVQSICRKIRRVV